MYARSPNFYRPVVALFGLPIDVVSLDEAARRLEQARHRKERCFLSTPNLNFAMQSQHDAEFRASVCRSDLSVADGMPLVWVARLLGLPLTERVSGSNLFEHLGHSRNRPWSVFFFGGSQGVGQAACVSLARGEDFFPVGHIFPGFGSSEAMSDPDLLACINAAQPDLLVVALGAVKGQSWITANLNRLQAPVVSHLGAVVNFMAGTVKRAPRWMQCAGLEWLWRSKEEPHLLRRYFKDGWALLRLFATSLFPLALHSRWLRWQLACEERCMPGGVMRPAMRVNEMRLTGVCAGEHLLPVRRAFTSAWNSGRDIVLDASELQGFDAGFVALLLILDTAMRDAGRQFTLQGFSVQHQRQLRWHGAAHLLDASA